MKKITDLSGQKFNRLTAIKVIGVKPTTWECICDCGAIKPIQAYCLTSGHTKSCGCYKNEVSAERLLTHGHCKGAISPTYISWRGMIARCNPDSNRPDSDHYAGRDIVVCDRWLHSFENFLADMGKRPKGMTIERIDNDKGYSPDNCRWASRYEQTRNQRSNRWLTFNGITLCLNDWAKEANLTREALKNRLKRGWPIEKALTKPIKQSPKL